MVLPPLGTVVAAAVRTIAGAGICTRTCVLAELLPVGPVQLTENAVGFETAGTVIVPLTGWGPVIPAVPVHAVA